MPNVPSAPQMCPAQQRLWDAHLSEAAVLNHSQQVGQRFAALKRIDEAAALLDTIGRSPGRDRQLRNAVLSSVALTDMRPPLRVGRLPAGGYASSLSFSADRYVVAAEGWTMTGYRLSDGQRLWSVECAKLDMPILSPDGRFLAAQGTSAVTVWRVDGAEPRVVWREPRAEYFTFAPDKALAAYSQPANGMQLIDLETASESRAIGQGPARVFVRLPRAERPHSSMR